MNYWDIIVSSYEGAAKGLWNYIINPIKDDGIPNFFYFLILISIGIWVLEIVIPWRKKQAIFRRDFWLDSFYMFFNFFIFRVVLFAALVKLTFTLFVSFLNIFGYKGGALIDLSELHWGLQLVLFFFIADLAQWAVHVLLHRVPILWRFHKVHHSVKEMGFAAHLRYHFMENVFYQPAKYVALSLIFGFELQYAFYVYYLATLIGHLNHANLNLDYGPFRYFLNNPKMHIWHHAKDLPEDRPYGMNYGISLSIWDYLFGTAHVPSDGRDIELGFDNDETYPQTFWGHLIEPFKRKK